MTPKTALEVNKTSTMAGLILDEFGNKLYALEYTNFMVELTNEIDFRRNDGIFWLQGLYNQLTREIYDPLQRP